jgi:hypothetical protein
VTPSQFRKLALSLPHASESVHMGTADFRVGGKIFATSGNPDPAWGVVGLTPDQQALLVETHRNVFVAVPGAWGSRGWTRVRLAAVDAATLEHALTLAWQSRAPKKLRGVASTQTFTGTKRASAKRTDTSRLDRVFARVSKAAKASKLPQIQEGTWYGTPALFLRGKSLMRVKDAETLVFRCTLEEKTFLMEAEPAVYYETDHYAGWPAVLVRAAAVSDAELIHCVARAWRLQAPKKLVAGQDPAIRTTRVRKTR